jgi:hypothetical protein
LYLQGREANAISALHHVNDTKDKLLALKERDGKTLAKVTKKFLEGGCFRNVPLKKTELDETTFSNIKCQFYQCLYDNISSRFPANDLLTSALVLNKAAVPADPLDMALFGESDVAKLCSTFKLERNKTSQVVLEYSLFKRTNTVGDNLAELINILKVLPVSSAECERGFSQMNLFHTSERSRLLVETVSALIMIAVTGPPLEHWQPEKYVISWLKSGKHGALDKATGLAKKRGHFAHIVQSCSPEF